MAYCDRCERWFPHDRALEQHKDNSNSHWFCYDCDLDFNSKASRMRHMDSQHWYCKEHDRVFKNEYGLEEHYRQSSDHYYCVQCRMLFNIYPGLEKHDHEVHDFCTECDRGFQNQNNLQQHLNSKLHRPSNFACPGLGCNRSFISAGALSLHFESGTCPSGMTRAQLDRLVVRVDRNNVITNPSRLIGGPGGYEAPTNPSSWATKLSWNGMAYECFLCHSEFDTLNSLNQHLQSPAHVERIYRCPNRDCPRSEFGTLSALCQHVERGSCGVRMFKQVRDVMDGLTKRFRTIGFR